MAPVDLRQALLALAAALLGTVVVHVVRALPWSLAAVVGVAIGVLVIAISRTGARLRNLWRDPSNDA